MADFPLGITHYNASGSNTLVQVSTTPVVLSNISVSSTGGSVGYLQLYNGGTANLTAGTLHVLTVPVFSGTAGAGTPSFAAFRDISYSHGKQFSQGLSYLWAAGTTGTVAHGVNATLDLTYSPQ